MIGDINICILQQTQTDSDFQCIVTSYGLEQLLNDPIRIIEHFSTYIDCLLVISRNTFECKPGTINLSITNYTRIIYSYAIGFGVNISSKTDKFHMNQLINVIKLKRKL